MSLPWDEAVESQYAALTRLEQGQKKFHKYPDKFPGYKDLEDDLAFDLSALRLAEASAWLDPALQAVQDASPGMLDEAPLTAEQLPEGNGQGWWFFRRDLPVETIDDPSIGVAALLWGLTKQPDESGQERYEVTFSAYIRTAEGEYSPSTKWFWRLGQSYAEMLAEGKRAYDLAYGVGGPWEGEPSCLGWEHTLRAVEYLSKFYLAACVWLDGDILDSTPQSIERHRRKAFVREHKLTEKEVPKLKLIALRHVKRTATVEMAAQTTTREYQCCWSVDGYFRVQRYGPGLLAKKVIYVNPHLAGPRDKPLKPKQKKVYVVLK